MGQSVGKIITDYCPESIYNVYHQIGQKRKRSISENEDESLLEKSLHSPKKIKLACTTEYIYKALFIDGGNCDIYVDILGKEWKLHKIYLQQSPYFASMFSGSWNETNKSHINIEVVDSNITLQSLTVVLGSLYFDEPSIEPSNAVSILATATLFQMDPIIDQCINLMLENISPLTAVEYYEASCQYGLESVKKATIDWFQINLMTYYPKDPKKLQMIDIDLMAEILGHINLVVFPTEFSLYILLKFWTYLQLNPKWTFHSDPDLSIVKTFFKQRSGKEVPFLLTPEGNIFINVFKNLRIQNLFLHTDDINSLVEDCIFPQSWLFPKIFSQYRAILKIYQSLDKGPTADLPAKEFFNSCVRCGRILTVSDPPTWRWNMFDFGLQLNWSVSNNVIKVERVQKTNELSFDDSGVRQVLVRIRVINVNNHRQITKSICSGLLLISLIKHGETKILDFGKDFEFPLIISMNILYITPEHKLQLDFNENDSQQEK